jgi:hypothetical protein
MRRAALKTRSRYKPVELERFHSWVAEHGCLVCGGPAEVHHVRGYADRPGQVLKDDWLVTPLCPGHHRIGVGNSASVEGLGHQGFYRQYGYDLHAEAMALAEQWRAA